MHLWEVTASEKFRPGSSFFHQNIQDGFYSLHFLAQAINEESLPRPLHITVVSNGMQSVLEGEGLAHPEKATLLGPVKVIPRELPDVTCKSVDVALPGGGDHSLRELVSGLARRSSRRSGEGSLDEIADLLARELHAASDSEIVAHRGRDRFVRRYEREPLRATKRDSESEVVGSLRQGGTYLITGGLGGLGLNLADRLARDHQANLILIGRSEMPPRAEWDEWLRTRGGEDTTGRRIRKIRDLEAAGAQVEIFAADVTNLEQMQDVIDRARSRFGPIHGFFHTAGVVKDELIALKRDADIEDVFGPKVHGTLVLDSLLEAAGAELFVLFSSTSAIAPPAGQIDYAAANAFLDAYAQSRAGGPVRTVSINWGIWSQIGMAAESFGDLEAGGSEPRVPLGPVDHPLFDERVRDSHGRTVFEKRYVAQQDWILDEHRTRGGQALVPGTGYPELARAALAEYGEKDPFEIRDLYFIRPLYVPDGDSRNVRVALRSFERGYRFEVRTGCEVDGRPGWALNAQATIEFGNREAPEPIDLAAIDARCQRRRLGDNPDGHRSGQENHVAFGPRWRVLREVVYGADEALARIELPEAFVPDLEAFGIHPAMLDYATGYAMDLIEGYRGEDALWVPVSYGRIAV
ncbi:MAG TPA: SDR family oxidoreductase, partial [Myxococcota bacterium]|nr:SDR family oxidoreductase [Myxococcota bacterium]